MNKNRVGIIGAGMVGGALIKWFEKQDNIQLLKYDPGKGLNDDINQADYIFICVPTPYKDELKAYDYSAIDHNLKKIVSGKTIILKSTVEIGITQKYANEYPNLIFLFNPEFLTEETASQDMSYPDRQIIGYTNATSYIMAGRIMSLLPLAPYEKIMRSYEAEAVKKFGNNWFCLKVSFNNQFYDYIQKKNLLDFDYEAMIEAAAADKRIGRSHLILHHKNKRGYSGKCLPKDSKSLICDAKRIGAPIELLEVCDKYNDELLKKQGLDIDR